MTLEEASFGLRPEHADSLALSPDSKYVCLPAGGAIVGTPPDQRGANVYSVTDQRRPLFTLQGNPPIIAFDPPGSSIYGWEADHLMLFGSTGTTVGQVDFRLRRFDGKPIAP